MGKQWKQWLALFWGGSKITADCDCSHEIKRHLLLAKKVMTNLDSILKSRDITLPTNFHVVKARVFSWASLVAQMVKQLPVMRETWFQFQGREDPLGKDMATQSSTRAWKTHGQRSLAGNSPWGGQESDTTSLSLSWFVQESCMDVRVGL